MKYEIPKDTQICPSAAQCDSETRTMCSAIAGIKLRSAAQSNVFADNLLRHAQAENDALRQTAAEAKSEFNNPLFSKLIDDLRNTAEAHIIDLVPATEYVAVCEGPKQRRFLGPVCTAQVVEVTKRV